VRYTEKKFGSEGIITTILGLIIFAPFRLVYEIASKLRYLGVNVIRSLFGISIAISALFLIVSYGYQYLTGMSDTFIPLLPNIIVIIVSFIGYVGLHFMHDYGHGCEIIEESDVSASKTGSNVVPGYTPQVPLPQPIVKMSSTPPTKFEQDKLIPTETVEVDPIVVDNELEELPDLSLDDSFIGPLVGLSKFIKTAKEFTDKKAGDMSASEIKSYFTGETEKQLSSIRHMFNESPPMLSGIPAFEGLDNELDVSDIFDGTGLFNSLSRGLRGMRTAEEGV